MTKPLRQALTILLAIIVILFTSVFGGDAIGFVAFPFTYSEGTRVGQVLKLSQKGMLWKTWEGALGITQSGAYVEAWGFSVDRVRQDADALIAALEEAQRTGDIVELRYQQHYGRRRWRGKTSYFIESVTVLR